MEIVRLDHVYYIDIIGNVLYFNKNILRDGVVKTMLPDFRDSEKIENFTKYVFTGEYWSMTYTPLMFCQEKFFDNIIVHYFELKNGDNRRYLYLLCYVETSKKRQWKISFSAKNSIKYI